MLPIIIMVGLLLPSFPNFSCQPDHLFLTCKQTQSEALAKINQADQLIQEAFSTIRDAESIFADTRILMAELSLAISSLNDAIAAYNISDWSSAANLADDASSKAISVSFHSTQLKTYTIIIEVVSVFILILVIVGSGIGGYFATRHVKRMLDEKRDQKLLKTRVSLPKNEESSNE